MNPYFMGRKNTYHWIDEFIPYMEIMGVHRPIPTHTNTPSIFYFFAAQDSQAAPSPLSWRKGSFQNLTKSNCYKNGWNIQTGFKMSLLFLLFKRGFTWFYWIIISSPSQKKKGSLEIFFHQSNERSNTSEKLKVNLSRTIPCIRYQQKV